MMLGTNALDDQGGLGGLRKTRNTDFTQSSNDVYHQTKKVHQFLNWRRQHRKRKTIHGRGAVNTSIRKKEKARGGRRG